MSWVQRVLVLFLLACVAVHRTTAQASSDSRVQCQSRYFNDSALDAMVTSAPTKTKLILLCHSEKDFPRLRKALACHDWISPVLLRKTPYIDAIVYKDYLRPLLQSGELDSYNYVIVRSQLTFGLGSKMVLSARSIKSIIETMYIGNYELVPFDQKPRQTLSQSLRSHSLEMRYAWEYTLFRLGFSAEEIDLDHDIFGFWKNSFAATPAVLRQLTRLSLEAMKIADLDRYGTFIFDQDARFRGGNLRVAQAFFGSSLYFKIHPFVFERLPAFFCALMNVSVPNLVSEHFQLPLQRNPNLLPS